MQQHQWSGSGVAIGALARMLSYSSSNLLLQPKQGPIGGSSLNQRCSSLGSTRCPEKNRLLRKACSVFCRGGGQGSKGSPASFPQGPSPAPPSLACAVSSGQLAQEKLSNSCEDMPM